MPARVGLAAVVQRKNRDSRGERRPEKAGVGGSIPSLATMFSSTYKYPQGRSCSILFQ
jgi:hypothetical protein